MDLQPQHNTLNARFWVSHLLIPLPLIIAVLYALEPGGLDLWLADRWYAFEGYRWSLRDNWFTYTVMHHHGKQAIILLWLSLGVLLALTWRNARLRPFRGTLAYLMTAMLLLPSLIASSKRFSPVPCPWDLARYGGEAAYRFNLDYSFGLTEAGHCFPAGHASGGYALLAFYFAAVPWVRRPVWFLLPGLFTGLAFGLGQQARGAHFLSHDVWTMSLCWLGSLLLYMLFRRRGWLPAPRMASVTQAGGPGT